MSYVSNIAQTVMVHAGEKMLLGPEFYAAIAECEKSDIPAAIVLISIDEVCMLESKTVRDDFPVEVFQSIVMRNFTTWLANTAEAVGQRN